jgi:hypothetical protein
MISYIAAQFNALYCNDPHTSKILLYSYRLHNMTLSYHLNLNSVRCCYRCAQKSWQLSESTGKYHHTRCFILLCSIAILCYIPRFFQTENILSRALTFISPSHLRKLSSSLRPSLLFPNTYTRTLLFSLIYPSFLPSITLHTHPTFHVCTKAHSTLTPSTHTYTRTCRSAYRTCTATNWSPQPRTTTSSSEL